MTSTQATSSKPKLYALLIGINNYPEGIKKLNGCHNDVQKMQAYLEKQADYFELQLAPPLLDADATKDKIVESFQTHFKAAKPEDTIVFYFSGHGCREEADPALWPNEYDRKLEGLVCYNPVVWNKVDSNDRIGPKVLLVDKELRYLIWELMQGHPDGQGPHVVMLADCCHSGDNTRAPLDPSTFGIRQVELTAKARALSDFIFPATWLQQKQAGSGWVAEDYQEGVHIQMGACQSHQLAKETALGEAQEQSGVFTHFLLDFLQQNQGNLSYYDLRYRLKVFTRFRYEQVPQVYIPPAHQTLYHRGFLNRPIKASTPFVAQMHHDDQKGWILNKGGLDSVSRRAKIKVSLDAGQSIEVQPIEVQTDMSVLELSSQDQSKLELDRTYPCQVEGLMYEPLNVFIDVKDKQNEAFINSLRTQLLEQVKGLNFVDTVGEGTYSLHLIQAEYRISKDHNPYRPLVKPIAMQQEGAVYELGQYLRQMSQWEYVKGLESEQVDREVFGQGLPLELYIEVLGEDGQYHPKAKEHEELILLPLTKHPDKWKNRIRIYVKSNYNQDLWICPLYLDTDFSVNPLLKIPVVQLEAGQTLMIREINISLKPHFYDYNWPVDVSTVKLIVSTHDNIEVAPLLLSEGLPLPIALDGVRRGGNRGMELDDENDVDQQQGWVTQQLTLQIPNPTHNSISKSNLEKMLAHPVLREYAEQIYLTPDSTPAKLELKDGISWGKQLES